PSTIKNISYATSTASTTIELPYDIVLTDASSTKVGETRNTYDNLALGSASLGNLTKQETWVATSSYASTTKVYNSYGLVTSSKDPNLNQTTYSYDSFNYYPATTTNPLSQATSYQYAYATGKVATTTDPNNLTTVSVYDPVGRVITQKQPDLTTPS